jgi:hypothetical protein
VIFFKVSLSLGIELAALMTRLGANFLSPESGIGATGLPTRIVRTCPQGAEGTGICRIKLPGR